MRISSPLVTVTFLSYYEFGRYTLRDPDILMCDFFYDRRACTFTLVTQLVVVLAEFGGELGAL